MVAQALVEELEKDRLRLQEELRAVRKSSELAAGSTSLTDVIEAQERRIAALQLAQKVSCVIINYLYLLTSHNINFEACLYSNVNKKFKCIYCFSVFHFLL